MSDPRPRIVDLAGVAAEAPPAVSLISVTLERSGKKLIDGLTLTLAGRGVTAVLGPNGAGKSLLLRMVAGLIAPTSGAVQIHPPFAGQVALVFQRPVLLRRTVRANLAHALRVYAVPRRQRAAQIARLLDVGGLGGLADLPARTLSGGEQQRLAMVRALAAAPRLLLLDEPTASLDPQSTLAIETLIRTAARDGTKILLVTHDHGQAQRLASEVVFLHHGQVTEQTPSHQFFARPASEAARTFLDGRLLL
ncbi:MAG: ATP-binding cassette domain-containing protein [Alphaproteobacteria bacterium]